MGSSWVAEEEQHHLKLEGYIPSKQEQKKRERVQRLLSKISPTSPKLDMKR